MSVVLGKESLQTCLRDMIFPVPPFFFFLRLIYYGFFYLFHHPRVDLAFKVLFRHPSCPFLNLPFLAGRLSAHCSGITSTLMGQKVSWEAFNVEVTVPLDICYFLLLSFI